MDLTHTGFTMPLPPAAPLALTPAQRSELMKILRYPGTPQAVALRCRVVLGAAEGAANHELARQLSTSLPTVLLWRRRFLQQGVLGILQDKPRPGRPRSLTPEKEAAIVEATRNTKPRHATHWSVRSMARHQSVSAATCSGSGRPITCNPIGSSTSSSAAIPSLSAKCATLLARI